MHNPEHNFNRNIDETKRTSPQKGIRKHRNYATLKGRGVDEKEYTLTIHRGPVRVKGFEYKEDLDKYVESLVRKIRKKQSTFYTDTAIQERFYASLSRSRSMVLQIASNNRWEYFVTLTLKRNSDDFDAYNLASVKAVLTMFFRNYARRSGLGFGFKYLLIPERHVDGAFHFHGLMMGINPKDLFVNDNGYLDFRPYAERFGHFSAGKNSYIGEAHEDFVGDNLSAGKIKNLDATAKYITKYISKSMFVGYDGNGDYNEAGAHLYFCSNGLKRDTLEAVGACTCGANDFEKNGYEVFKNDFCAKIKIDLETGLDCIAPFEKLKPELNLEEAYLLMKEERRKLLWFKSNRDDEKAQRIKDLREKLENTLTYAEVQELEKLFSDSSGAPVSASVTVPEYEQVRISL